MKTISVLLIVVSFAMGHVTHDSLHKSDMNLLNEIISDRYTAEITCQTSDLETNIGIRFDEDWVGSDFQIEKLGYSLGAIGNLTAKASWHSDYCIVAFNDMGFMCTTASAGDFAAHADTWSTYQIEQWIDNNLLSGEL